ASSRPTSASSSRCRSRALSVLDGEGTSTRALRDMPSLQRRVLSVVLLAGAVLGLEFAFDKILPDAAWRQVAMFAMVNVIVALSLNVINGMAGQFSIGHAGFVGIGAYTAAIVAGHLDAKLSIHAERLKGIGESLTAHGFSSATAEKVDALLRSLLVMPPA